MPELPDLKSRADVARMVRSFYETAMADPMLKGIFERHLDLDEHMPIMTDFWETVLFRAGKYRRNALQVHFDIHVVDPLEWPHFERWLEIWKANVDSLYAGEHAERAKLQATRIGASIHRRLHGRNPSQFETVGTREETT
ncbi:group III truncated hemoglobin [Spelaeicoccus albus]|uniref:Hemoglobin n=1 Tax=Spelaeicoccus albus TaxID=1280376 RepID=A0A7Z0D1D2_9MICO|nr:group III truncated hemoglobin [Spelaeicoccus albus]NYI66057.1 hemoglobin [Spelaeicoccus albus]